MQVASSLRVCTVRQRLIGMLTRRECCWLSQYSFTSRLSFSSSSSSSFSSESDTLNFSNSQVDKEVANEQQKDKACYTESQRQRGSLEEEVWQEQPSTSSSSSSSSQSASCLHRTYSIERKKLKCNNELNAIEKRVFEKQLEKEAVSERLRCLFQKQPVQTTSGKKENNEKMLWQENECKLYEQRSSWQLPNEKEKEESQLTTPTHSEFNSINGNTSTYQKRYNTMYNLDEDEHENEHDYRVDFTKKILKSNRISVEVLEEELIDDNYACFPEISSQPLCNKMFNNNDVNGVVAEIKGTTRENVHTPLSVKTLDEQQYTSKSEMIPSNYRINDSCTKIDNGGESWELQEKEQQEQPRRRQQQQQEKNHVWTSHVTYVPGQQIIEPGLTRYRLEVQYQGCDFDGWFKSTKRRLLRRTLNEDGSVRYEQIQSNGNVSECDEEPNISNSMTDEMSVKYCVKTVLEEALSVALDVAKVNVVASVIPETGVSVRRLTCHVDIPSEIEMQPRTILQRATMWLEQRRQPLALLSFVRCVNQDFHARFSCTRRIYCYRILNRIAPPLFDAGLQWHVDRYLNIHRMKRFAELMTGTHDYGYFTDPKMANALRRAALSVPGRSSAASVDEHYTPSVLGLRVGEQPRASKETFEKGLSNLQRARALPTFNEYGQKVISYDAKSKNYYKAATNLPTVRTIDSINIVRQEDEIIIWFVGQSFLRHQIRNMVSVLKAAGNGLWDEHELQYALNSGFTASRNKFSRERLPPAPVHGLTLWDVEYSRKHQDDKIAFVHSGPLEEVNASNITSNL